MNRFILPIIMFIIILLIISYSLLDSKTNIMMRLFTIIIYVGILLLICLFLKKNGIGIIFTIIILGILILIYLINLYIKDSCSHTKGQFHLLLYLSLALGLYFFFNQTKKLGDCSYKSFALTIIFSTLVGSLVIIDAPVFILCLFIMYNILF
jgi:hypothetical protein